MVSGEDAGIMTRALIMGREFPPPGIDDSAENRQFWDDTAMAIENLPPGVSPDMPVDWTTTPDPEPAGGDFGG